MRLAHTGTPRTKFLVPSIGSMTHCRPAKLRIAAELLAEHVVAGTLEASTARSARSTARSASDTA